jgi:predicted nucleic acid-binding protein
VSPGRRGLLVPWVVDTSILIDVAEDDPAFGRASATILEERLSQGLTVCPVTYVELAPVFEGRDELQEEFLGNIGIEWTQAWTWQDTRVAFQSWNECVRKRRTGILSKRPIADILIGAFARRFDGLITRNAKEFSKLFPDLRLLEPKRR